ncbi:MAG: sigma factor-like helix-turn-helix DNA-binding protein, partial [Candidatus Saccharimonadales bacterium]
MADTTVIKPAELDTERLVNETLATIDREREREIVSRRFGLFDRKETLEQIGELLGITRERVRQLEKAVVTRLKATAEQGNLPNITEIQTTLTTQLQGMGGIARVSDLAAAFGQDGQSTKLEQARVAFLARLCPELSVVDEDDHFYQSVSISSIADDKAVKAQVQTIIDAIKKLGEPKTIDEVAKATGMTDTAQTAALASTSKHLATLNSRWGLVKWPMVNPKNIRDKIYVILKENGKHMHFNE